MIDQSNQTSQAALHAQELRQFMLDQLSAEQKVGEELSDEELRAVAGGGSSSGEMAEAVEAIRRGLQHPPSAANEAERDAAGLGHRIKKWAQKPSNQVAVGGPVVTASAAFMVGFVNKATS